MLYPGPPPGAPQHYEQDPSGAGSIAVPVVKPMANQPQVLLMLCHMLVYCSNWCVSQLSKTHSYITCICNLQVEEVPELEDSFSDLVLVNKEN